MLKEKQKLKKLSEKLSLSYYNKQNKTKKK